MQRWSFLGGDVCPVCLVRQSLASFRRQTISSPEVVTTKNGQSRGVPNFPMEEVVIVHRTAGQMKEHARP